MQPETERQDGTEAVTGMMNAKLDEAFRAADALYARADAMQMGTWADEAERGGSLTA